MPDTVLDLSGCNAISDAMDTITFYEIRLRRPRSDAEPQARHTEEIGLVDGIVSRETWELKKSRPELSEQERTAACF
jgi:hypothetical protein